MFYFMIHFVLYTRLTPIGGGIPEMQAYTSFSLAPFILGRNVPTTTLGLGHYDRWPNVNGKWRTNTSDVVTWYSYEEETIPWKISS